MALSKKKKRTTLPRVTVLSMSRAELVRFSTSMEQVAGLAHMMVGLMTRLDAAVTRLEQRSESAKKANRTRQAMAADQVAADQVAADQANGKEKTDGN